MALFHRLRSRLFPTSVLSTRKPRRGPLWRHPCLEILEDRLVLSNIIWTNRGPNDGFDAVFGAPAESARNVVDAAIDLWERIIPDFRQPGGLNAIAVDIRMNRVPLVGGFTLHTLIEPTGLPLAGTITLHGGDDLNGDFLGDGGGYYIDPNPSDSAEFSGTIVNAFVGKASANSPAVGQRDFFSLVAHELGHLLGINVAAALRYNSGGFTTKTEIPDNSNGGNGTYWVFEGPSVSFLMTDSNAISPLFNPVHSASDGETNLDFLLNGVLFDGQRFFGHEDIMNVGGNLGTRQLPSNATALILHDAYGYDIVSAERFGTMHALLNSTTGELLIRGGQTPPDLTTSSDEIRLSRDGDDLVVSVDLGLDPRGVVLGSTNAFVSRFPFNSIGPITIQAGDGDDTVTLDFTGGDVIPDGGIRYDGGDGVNHINATANANFVLTDAQLGVSGFGFVGLTSVADADLTGGFSGNTFDVSGWSGTGALDGAGANDFMIAANNTGNFILSNGLLRSSGRGDIALQGIDEANLFGGPDDTQFTVSGWTGIANLSGGGGLNRVVSTNDADFTLTNAFLSRSTGGTFGLQGVTRATLTGGVSANTFTLGWTGNANVNGGFGADQYIVNLNTSATTFGVYQINDLGTSGTDVLTVNGTSLAETLTVRNNTVLRGTSNVVTYAGIDRLQVNSGNAADTVTIQSTSSALAINTGPGNDTVNVGYSQSIVLDPNTGQSTIVKNIPASVTVEGSTGTTDTLNVSLPTFPVIDGQLTSNQLTGNTLGVGGLNYSTVELLNLTFGGSPDQLAVLSTAAGVTTTINMGNGTDTVRLGGATVNNIRGPLTINGGANAAGSVDTVILQEFEPAGVTNNGFLGTPSNAGAGVGFLGGFGMGGPSNNARFSNTENVQIITGPSNDFVSFQFATVPPRFTFNLSLDGGNDGVVFQGTARNDRIHISRQVGAGGAEVIAQINGRTVLGGYQGGETISVFAGAGNDHVTVDPSVTTWRTELYGEAGNDRLVGGVLAALLDGGAGNDDLVGGDDVDELVGGPGVDRYDGGAGADRIRARDFGLDIIYADDVDQLLDLDAFDLVIRRRR